jgi:hypothetical protein
MVGCALLVHAPSSHADTPPPQGDDTPKRAPDPVRDEASARFKRGLQLFGEDNYAAALVEFRKAYELTHNYKVLYNIGQVCFQIHDYVCALTSFESYVSAGASEIPPDRASEVQQDIATLESRIGYVAITTSVAGVDIAIDDVPRGTTPLAAPIALNAGTHRVSARKQGALPEARLVEVAGTEHVTLDIAMRPAPVQRVVIRSESPSRWTTWSWVGLGTATALGVASAVTGAYALSASKDLQSTQYVMTPSADASSVRTRTKTLSLTSDVLGIAALGTLATTLVLTFTRSPTATESPRPNVAVDVTAGGVMVHGVFQ